RPRRMEVLVWGAVKWDGRTHLHTSTSGIFDESTYVNIIHKHLIEEQPNSFERFLQDNASQHKSDLTLSFFKGMDIELVQHYPPYSPELNPIEHVWSWMVTYVKQEAPETLDQLKKTIKQAWLAVPQEVIQGYIAH